MIHTVKGFHIVNEGEVDVFSEFSCVFYDPTDVANPADLGPLPFLNPYYVFHNIVLFVRLGIIIWMSRDSQVVLVVKNLPAKQETQEMWVWSLGQEDPLEEEMATQSSILAWKIPRTEDPGGLQSMGLQRIVHNCAHAHLNEYWRGLSESPIFRLNTTCSLCAPGPQARLFPVPANSYPFWLIISYFAFRSQLTCPQECPPWDFPGG